MSCKLQSFISLGCLLYRTGMVSSYLTRVKEFESFFFSFSA